MDLKVHINDIHGSQMAAKINGNFTLDNHEFHFTAIAFGRIGGQNIGAKLSQITELLNCAGFQIKHTWLDDDSYFSVTLASKN